MSSVLETGLVLVTVCPQFGQRITVDHCKRQSGTQTILLSHDPNGVQQGLALILPTHIENLLAKTENPGEG